jgi:GT2 family glycosyltransferase
MKQSKPLLSIIIVSYNTRELLEKCLNSVIKSLAGANFKSNQEKILNQVQDDANRNRHPDESQDLPLALTQIPDQVRNDGFQVRHYNPAKGGADRHHDDPPAGGQDLPAEIIVVDNHSSDDSVAMLENLKLKLENSTKIENLKLKIIVNNDNLGFAKAVNQGIKKSRGEYLLLLNSDTIVSPQALEKMIEFARKKKDAGIIAPKLLDKNGKTSQPSCYRLPTIKGAIKEFWLGEKGAFGKYLPRGGNPVKPEAVVGAAMLIPRTVYDVVGEFDEKYFMYYEDLDYCRRVREAGFAVYYLPTAKIIHYHGQSGQKEPQKVNRYLIESSKKYHGRLKHFFLNAIIRLGQAKKFLPLILLVLAMLAWSVHHLYFLKPILPKTHDGHFHLIRLFEFDRSIKAGIIPPRWAPGLANGLGAPVFNYFYPLIYYLGEGFHLLGFSFVFSLKLVAALSCFAAFFFSFLFFKLFFATLPSFLGASLVVYAPYSFLNLFVRGDFPEALALSLLPAIFWATAKAVLNKEKSRHFLLAALPWGLIILSHNIVALIATVWLIIFLFLVLIRDKQTAKKTIFIFLLSLALSAFFWAPALGEMPYVHLIQEKASYWWDHFPTLRQLIYSSWGHGYSYPGQSDEMSFQIGLPHLFLAFSAGALFLIRFIKEKKEFWRSRKNQLLLFFSLSSLFFIFLTNRSSSFLWQNIPLLAWVQFPWRFLGFLNFSLCFLITFFLEELLFSGKEKIVLPFVFFLFAGIFFTYFDYTRPESYLSEREILDSQEAGGTTTSHNETLPIWAPKDDYQKIDLTNTIGCRDFSCEKVVSLKKEEEITFRKFYFPSWQGKIDNFPLKLYPQEKTGLMAASVPAGNHQVRIEWGKTNLEKAADYISLASFIFLFSFIAISKKRKN